MTYAGGGWHQYLGGTTQENYKHLHQYRFNMLITSCSCKDDTRRMTDIVIGLAQAPHS